MLHTRGRNICSVPKMRKEGGCFYLGRRKIDVPYSSKNERCSLKEEEREMFH